MTSVIRDATPCVNTSRANLKNRTNKTMNEKQENDFSASRCSASGFECTWEEYKEQAATFFRRLKASPTMTERQVERGLKAIGLAFIYVKEDPMFKGQAQIVLNLAHKKADEFLWQNKEMNSPKD